MPPRAENAKLSLCNNFIISKHYYIKPRLSVAEILIIFNIINGLHGWHEERIIQPVRY